MASVVLKKIPNTSNFCGKDFLPVSWYIFLNTGYIFADVFTVYMSLALELCVFPAGFCWSDRPKELSDPDDQAGRLG